MVYGMIHNISESIVDHMQYMSNTSIIDLPSKSEMKTYFLSMSSWVVCRSLRLHDGGWTSTGAKGEGDV